MRKKANDLAGNVLLIPCILTSAWKLVTQLRNGSFVSNAN